MKAATKDRRSQWSTTQGSHFFKMRTADKNPGTKDQKTYSGMGDGMTLLEPD